MAWMFCGGAFRRCPQRRRSVISLSALFALAAFSGLFAWPQAIAALDLAAALRAVDDTAARICGGDAAPITAVKEPAQIRAALGGFALRLQSLTGASAALPPAVIERLLHESSGTFSDPQACQKELSSKLYSAMLIADAPQTQIVPLRFSPTPIDRLPPQVRGHYEQLIADSETAGVGLPHFYLSARKMPADRTGIFIKAINAIACSADGQCPIDFFAPRDDGYELVFSVVARNIGTIENPSRADQQKDIYPILATNITTPEEFDTVRQNGNQPLTVELSKIGGVWRWNGKTYAAEN